MENILVKYFSKRMDEAGNKKKEPGPVITISREYGCGANKIAALLIEGLNEAAKKEEKTDKWRYINKEILTTAAQELNANSEYISGIFQAEEKNLLGDIVISFSNKQYLSDSKILKTIAKVIRAYSEEGHVVIVGRAGCMMARDIEKSIHVKLIAPFEWRVKNVSERFELSHADAKARVVEMDKKRADFMAFYRGNKPDCEVFDVILNRATLSPQEIVDSILQLAKTGKLG